MHAGCCSVVWDQSRHGGKNGSTIWFFRRIYISTLSGYVWLQRVELEVVPAARPPGFSVTVVTQRRSRVLPVLHYRGDTNTRLANLAPDELRVVE